jgi:two-component system cell cycle sensor histidine kinase/response regulator CckA
MFEAFFTTKGEGSGIGLSTAYRIVQKLGGYITASSAKGLGTAFVVYLPAATAEPVAERSQPSAAPARGSETILLVDDEPAVRAVAGRLLQDLGYRVLEAAHGPQALSIAKEYDGPIHLLLTDVVMPNMSGRELAFQLAPRRPEMKVMYMSGHIEEAIVHHGVLDADVAFLQKPFQLQALAAMVREVLDANRKPEPVGRPAV